MARLKVVPRPSPLESRIRDLFDDLLQHDDPDPDSYSTRRFNMNAAIVSATAPGHRPVDLYRSAHVLKAACLGKMWHQKAEQDRQWYRDLDGKRNAARKALDKAQKALGDLHRFVGVTDNSIAPETIASIIARDPVLGNPDWFNRAGDENPDYRASGAPGDPNFNPRRVVLRTSGPRVLQPRPGLKKIGNPLRSLPTKVDKTLDAYGWTGPERRQLLYAVGLKDSPKDERE